MLHKDSNIDGQPSGSNINTSQPTLQDEVPPGSSSPSPPRTPPPLPRKHGRPKGSCGSKVDNLVLRTLLNIHPVVFSGTVKPGEKEKEIIPRKNIKTVQKKSPPMEVTRDDILKFFDPVTVPVASDSNLPPSPPEVDTTSRYHITPEFVSDNPSDSSSDHGYQSPYMSPLWSAVPLHLWNPPPPPPTSSSSSTLSSSESDDDLDPAVVVPDIAGEETIGISEQADLDLALPENVPVDDIIHLSAEFIDDNPEVLVNTLVEATDHAYISLSTPQALLLLPSNRGLGQPFDKFTVRCLVVHPTGTKLHRMRK